MAGEVEQLCRSGCRSITKYCCIRCNVYVCNRPFCLVAEVDENVDGWMENSSVSYCNDCIFGSTESSQFTKLSLILSRIIMKVARDIRKVFFKAFVRKFCPNIGPPIFFFFFSF